MRAGRRVLLVFLMTVPSSSCTAGAAIKSAASPYTQDLRQVIANVRQATGMETLDARTGSFEFEGTTTSDGPAFLCAQPYRERLCFTLDGKFRREYSMIASLPSVLGYDGEHLWMNNIMIGTERFDDPGVLMAHWLITGAWLARLGDLSLTIVESECTVDDVVLSMCLRKSHTVRWLIIDRRTWCPRALCLPNHRDSPEWQFGEYQSELGIRLPHKLVAYPRAENSVWVQSFRTSVKYDKLKKAEPVDRELYVQPEPHWRTTLHDESPPDIECKVAKTGHVLAKASLDDSEPRWFLLDSGADGLYLDSDEADRLNLPNVFEIPQAESENTMRQRWVSCRRLRIGPLSMQKPVLSTLNLAAFQVYFGQDFVGIMGYNAFAEAVVEIDATKPSIRLFRPNDYDKENLQWHPIRFAARLPFVHCEFDGGNESDFLIDTGSNGGVTLFQGALEKIGISKRDAPASRSANINDSTTISMSAAKDRIRLDWFEIAGCRLRNIEISVEKDKLRYVGVDCAGTIGMEILSQFKVVFDYPNQRIAFVKHPAVARTEGKKSELPYPAAK